MFASIQMSFRVVVCRLRTNNEFKLRVLIYRKVFRRGSLETAEGIAEKGHPQRVRLQGFQYQIFEDSKYGATEGIDGP
ncbi:hypothetical protein MTR67_017656 [Solanum verrucosum]|uniref:Uncharacterized protein n=1 Tax=Solanum verrucosum TaxID=315347 RepID=A0AAF0QJ79_SOLVR|nr:hypothetical protein MTR67_017656 [Solanum verrucosum]